MGKTVPSYRMALEFEIERWKGFRKALQSEEEREAFRPVDGYVPEQRYGERRSLQPSNL